MFSYYFAVLSCVDHLEKIMLARQELHQPNGTGLTLRNKKDPKTTQKNVSFLPVSDGPLALLLLFVHIRFAIMTVSDCVPHSGFSFTLPKRERGPLFHLQCAIREERRKDMHRNVREQNRKRKEYCIRKLCFREKITPHSSS